MTPTTPPGLDLGRIKVLYEWAEQRYLRSLPPEHFMEATDHAHQRKITLESFDLVHVARPDIQCFNELLVQYPRPGHDPDKPGQVVPDNFVVVHPKPIKAVGSYMTPLQPVGPLLVLEYVSKHNKRKDYDDNLEKYEKELKVPYYLLFYPGNEELTLFRMRDGRYIAVPPDGAGRVAIPELELEAGLLDGWVRYWFRGELLPLPEDLLRQLTATRDQLAAAKDAQATAERRATAAERQAEREQQARMAAETEVQRLRDEVAKAKGQP